MVPSLLCLCVSLKLVLCLMYCVMFYGLLLFGAFVVECVCLIWLRVSFVISCVSLFGGCVCACSYECVCCCFMCFA